MRLFIALNLTKKDRQRVLRATRSFREGEMPVRWVDEENLHLTLKFLGEVRPEQIPAVEDAMARVGGSTVPFGMTLSGFGAFPTIRCPSVLWLGVQASAELRCLKQDLEWGLTDCGFDAETRAFHPHVTLGRASDKDGAGAFRGLDALVAAQEILVEIPIHSVYLMRSVLSREGARYSVVSSAKLTGS